MAYEINYDDKRFTEVEADKKAALSEVNKTYTGMINNSDKYYQQQIDASKDWADKQQQLQQQQTDFAIDKIEQQKEQAKKDYTKEQSGAYVDWQKQSNEYGAKAEQMAFNGMSTTGYAESSQVSMYNTYQNRISAARELYFNAKLNYDNAIKDARLQNNSALAEIAYKALQQQLELSLQGFQYKNQLLLEQANRKFDIESEYHNRYLNVLNQINTENALAEDVRQFNAQMAEEQRQFNFANKLGEFAVASSGGGGGSSDTPKRRTPPKDDKDDGGDDDQQVEKDNDSSTSSTSDKKNKNEKIVNQSTVNPGPLSAKFAAQLVDAGLLTQTKVGSKIYFTDVGEKPKINTRR